MPVIRDYSKAATVHVKIAGFVVVVAAVAVAVAAAVGTVAAVVV